MASRGAGMKCGFWGRWPLAAWAALQGKPGVPGRPRRGLAEPRRARSRRCLRFLLITLQEALRERPFLLASICFFIASAPFPTPRSVSWLVWEMPRPVLTLEGWERGECRHPHPRTPFAMWFPEGSRLRAPCFTDLNDLGGGGEDWYLKLLVAYPSVWRGDNSGDFLAFGNSLGVMVGLFGGILSSECCSFGLRSWASGGARRMQIA